MALIAGVIILASDELEVGKYVDEICETLKLKSYESQVASWNYQSNITKENQKIDNEVQQKLADFNKKVALNLLQKDTKSFQNKTLKRLIKKLSNIGDQILDEKEFLELKDATQRMQENYAKVRIPSFKDKSKIFQLEPEITEILASSSDPNELEYFWTNWYNLAGTPCKEDFFKYAELKNKAARLNREFERNLTEFHVNLTMKEN